MSSAKWKLERFYDRLEEWARSVDPPPDAYAAVKNWIDSRQDAPHGDAWPLPADDGDAEFRALVVDIYRRPIMCHGHPVTCTYVEHDDEGQHVLACQYFANNGSLLQIADPPGW